MPSTRHRASNRTEARAGLLTEARSLIIRAQNSSNENQGSLFFLQYGIERALRNERRTGWRLRGTEIEETVEPAVNSQNLSQDDTTIVHAMEGGVRIQETTGTIDEQRATGESNAEITGDSLEHLEIAGGATWHTQDWDEALRHLEFDPSTPRWPSNSEERMVFPSTIESNAGILRRVRESAPEPGESQEELSMEVETGSHTLTTLERNELHRTEMEDTSMTSVIADASRNIPDGIRCKPAPVDETKPAGNRPTREDLIREMRADMERYSCEREREFGREHGYCLYSPCSSDEGQISEEEDHLSEETESPGSFRLRSRTETRASVVGNTSEWVEGNGSGDADAIPDSFASLAENIARRRTQQGNRSRILESRDAARPQDSMAPFAEYMARRRAHEVNQAEVLETGNTATPAGIPISDYELLSARALVESSSEGVRMARRFAELERLEYALLGQLEAMLPRQIYPRNR